MEDTSTTHTSQPSSITFSVQGTAQSLTSNAQPLVLPDSTHQRLSCSGEGHFQPINTPTISLCHTRCGEPTAGESLVRANSNAARERTRVRTLRRAFLELQRTLPAVPRDTKLSKLDVLVLATTYIAHLTSTLARSSESESHESNARTSLAESDVCRDRVLAGSELLKLASSTRRDAWSLGSHNCGMMLARRELSHSCGTDGASRGVKNNGISGLRSHGYLHPVKTWVRLDPHRLRRDEHKISFYDHGSTRTHTAFRV